MREGNVEQPLQNGPHRERRELFNAINCIYICVNSEELYESNAPDKAYRLWIDKEAIASMAAVDSHLKNSILDMWSIIMNKKQLSRETMHPSRFFFTTYTTILHAQKASFKYQEFYKVMQLETQRTNWLNFNTIDLMCSLIQLFIVLHVFFPILRSEHFFLIVFQFADKTVNIIDNLTLPKNPSTRYGNCDSVLKHFFSKYLMQRGRPKAKEVKNFRTIYVKTDNQDSINLHDCGIYTMRHMETYYGNLPSWDHGFQEEKETLLRTLRAKYAARIFLHPDDMLRDNTLRKAKLETEVR
ncbi:hypothetical protein Cgig2_032128 [Carnegiea gigantea]|uniref:Ubiquitin-like protease family profile domain-containing protein n=1 Tax=Carnegiea gigantea TaxID=171969 RepID=A0A9Q1JSW2_9CARY|nr:hypothetical protein Cgig2_032128 [Carnegiea gigantea]